MKNVNTKRNKINIIFSSFLVIGYIICTYFFSSLASQLSGTLGSLIHILMLAVFGLLLFYATRVGEGKQVRRFSLAVLLLIDLPALYIILASLVPALPFHDAIAPQNTLMLMGMGGVSTPSLILGMACVALGYGLPYTFFAGYEIKEEDDEIITESAPVEGGLAEELAATDAEKTDGDEKDVETADEETKETEEAAAAAEEEEKAGSDEEETENKEEDEKE